jgi:hypothetical protein
MPLQSTSAFWPGSVFLDMTPPSRHPTDLASYLYPGPGSSRNAVIVALGWSGLVGIIMVIGLFIDHGWIGRIGAVIVLGGLVLPLWIRGMKLLRGVDRPGH